MVGDQSENSHDSVQNGDGGDIFASPTFTPRHVVSAMGVETQSSKPVDVYKRDNFHGKETTVDRNVLKKLESVKDWSVNTFKCTKQIIGEKLGTTIPTCDQKLDLRIQTLRQMQRQYRFLLESIRQLSATFAKTVHCQRELAGQLATLGQQQIELAETFANNAEIQKNIAVNGEKLMCVMDTVCNGISTLVHHTFDDTMLTIRNMNMARVQYDADRKEADALKATGDTSNDPAQLRRVELAVTRFTASEENFLRLKAAVDAKLRLLHENRIRVMQHNLLLLHKATTAYSSGNMTALDQTLKQFNVKTHSPTDMTKSANSTNGKSNQTKRFSLRKSQQ